MLGAATEPTATTVKCRASGQEGLAGPILGVMGLLVLGVAVLVLFYSDAILPMQPAIVVLFGLAAWGVVGMKFSKGWFLTRLMIVAYTLPFSVLISNVVNPDHLWWRTPIAVSYIKDQRLIEQMVAIGTIGLVGLLLGMRVAVVPVRKRRFRSATSSTSPPQPTLPPLSFLVLLTLAMVLSWLSAPTKDIFTMGYAAPGTHGLAQSINFNAAALVSYVILVLLMIDAERETASPPRRKLKYQAVLAVATFIVVVLQVLRGDRESSGLVLGLLAIYLTGPDRGSLGWSNRVIRRRFRKVALPAVVLMLVFVGLGSARDRLSYQQTERIDLIATLRNGFEQATWTGVLLTNLAITAEYRYGPMSYVRGETYRDYLVSLPPGFVTQAIGVERPLERTRGPVFWTSSVASGGSHVLIVPFKNFGAAGVFVVLGLYGFAAVRCEELGRLGSLRGRLLLGTFAASSLQWFWYGDLAIVRGLLAALILGGVYHLATVKRSVPASRSLAAR